MKYGNRNKGMEGGKKNFGDIDFIFIELINRCNDWQAWLTVQRIVLIVSSVEFASGYGKRSIDKRG